MNMDILLGLQWGDEGKGKIVDVLSPDYDLIARFQGGPNAGHSLEFEDFKHVLHSIPSGIFRDNTINLIGNGVVLDPLIFMDEIDKIEEIKPDALKRLFISKKAHLILPTHKLLDAASEAAKGITKIGSTLKGIGPTYMDKTGRNGLRVGDILEDNFLEKYDFLKNKHLQMLKQYDFDFNYLEDEEDWFEGIELMKKFKLVDGEYYINDALNDNKKVLAEGAQGTLLDIEFGSYPFVTSSNTVSSGANIGLGVAPNRVGKIYGIFKSYCTRVGSGPFPTELFDQNGKYLQTKGHEFGATTGRERRCGWMDLPALKYAIMLNGVTDLIMTKADVLSGLETFKVAVAYDIKGQQTTNVPFEFNQNIKPVLKEFKGWKTDLSGIDLYDKLPQELKDYISFIEKETNVPVNIISVGADRKETIIRK
ncbi:MAG: adenylosuccinate synthase [Bacteroidales bacterium]|nr:adenylosuccinate synthase [Bacteroidales bacterium]MBN2758465.1 adenylosuccinate synthase [Bacteroidales bacterium]